MKTKTMLAHAIDTADNKARYDASCKSLLSNKIILAWIMKSCLQEYANIPVEEIASHYILGEPQVGNVPVFADEVANEDEKIPHPSVEDNTMTDGLVRFENKFNALLPEGGEPSEMSLILNVDYSDLRIIPINSFCGQYLRSFKRAYRNNYLVAS
jgi:hypothetical protein